MSILALLEGFPRARRQSILLARSAVALDHGDQNDQDLSPLVCLPSGHLAPSCTGGIRILALVHQAIFDAHILATGVGLTPGCTT